MKQNAAGHVSGSVSDRPIIELLSTFHTDKSTGILEVQHDGVARQLFVEKGDVVFATSNDPRENPAYLLLCMGKITRQQFDQTEGLAHSDGKRQAALLVELGFIAPKELFVGVKIQVAEIIYSLLAEGRGDFVFIRTPIPRSDIIMLKLNMPALLMEGVRRSINPLQVEWLAGPHDRCLRVLPQHSWIGCNVMTEEEVRVWKLIAEGGALGKVIEQSGLPQEMVLRVVSAFIAGGLVEKTEEQVCAVDAFDPALVRKEAHAFHNAMQGKNHYEVLGVAATATPKAIRSAYVALSKKYHPDVHCVPELEDIKKVMEEVFSRITQAYDMLMDPEKRRDYDMFLAASAPPIRVAAIKRKAGQPDNKDMENAKQQFGRGMAEYKKGDYWGAVDSFLWATRLNPTSGLYALYVGRCLQHMPRRLEEAEEYFLKAIELESFNLEYYLDLGRYYLQVGQKEKADNAFREVIKLDPHNEAALTALGAQAGKGVASSQEDSDKGIFGRLFGR
ncbi:MAG: DnaJ domain-containing protein [Nitrospirota bacterium]|nr:DnaJ domain-containing protein [Nitrospirota bacterium]